MSKKRKPNISCSQVQFKKKKEKNLDKSLGEILMISMQKEFVITPTFF